MTHKPENRKVVPIRATEKPWFVFQKLSRGLLQGPPCNFTTQRCVVSGVEEAKNFWGCRYPKFSGTQSRTAHVYVHAVVARGAQSGQFFVIFWHASNRLFLSHKNYHQMNLNKLVIWSWRWTGRWLVRSQQSKEHCGVMGCTSSASGAGSSRMTTKGGL